MMDEDNNNPLRKFIQNLDPNENFPKNYEESPIYQRGFSEGASAAWKEANRVIDSIRNILEIHDDRYD